MRSVIFRGCGATLPMRTRPAPADPERNRIWNRGPRVAQGPDPAPRCVQDLALLEEVGPQSFGVCSGPTGIAARFSTRETIRERSLRHAGSSVEIATTMASGRKSPSGAWTEMFTPDVSCVPDRAEEFSRAAPPARTARPTSARGPAPGSGRRRPTRPTRLGSASLPQPTSPPALSAAGERFARM